MERYPRNLRDLNFVSLSRSASSQFFRHTQARLQFQRQHKNQRCRFTRSNHFIGVVLIFIAAFGLQTQGLANPKNLRGPRTVAYHEAQYPHGFVDVRKVIPGIKVDLRYASSRNVSGKNWYPKDMPCLLYAPTARKLALAQQILKSQGYQLLIWDAWRPTEIAQALYDYHKHLNLFANPNVGWSFHCIGTAVDVSLLDSKGREIKMPSDFDETEPAVVQWMIASFPQVNEHLTILKKAMHEAGFASISREWWHFEDREFHSRRKPKAIPAEAMGVLLPPVGD